MKTWIQKHLFLFMASFTVFYITVWIVLENIQFSEYHMMHCRMDDWIPFNEYFVLPYLLWFLLFPGVFFYLYFRDREECFRYSLMLVCGMTLFLAISVVFPNGQELRPEIDPEKNIFTRFLSMIWATDTSTNVFPSIHVYNAAAAQIAVFRSAAFRRHRIIQWLTFVLVILICLATVFLKQHSVLDGIGALVMLAIFYVPIYRISKPVFEKEIPQRAS